jgi:hypothetical protein
MRQSVHWERALGTAYTSIGNGLHEQNLVNMKSFIWLKTRRCTWRQKTSLFWRWPLDTICSTGESPWPNNAMQHMQCTSITLNYLTNRSRSFSPLNRSQTWRIHASTGERPWPSYTMQQMHENPQQHPHRSHYDSTMHNTTNTSIKQLVNQRYQSGYMILHMYKYTWRNCPRANAREVPTPR